MHVVFLTHEYPINQDAHGGVGSFVQTLARAIVRQGFSVDVVGVYFVDTEQKIDDMGVRVWRLPHSTLCAAKFVENAKRINHKLWEIQRASPIDIIEGPELSFAFVDRNLPARKIIRMHGGHHFFAVTLGKKPALWRSFQEKLSFSKATHFCAVSQYVADETKKMLHLKKRVNVIYNPVDFSCFHEIDVAKMIPHSILFVGTVCEKKGIRQLILSLEHLIAKYADVCLLVAGRDWKGKGCESYIQYLLSIVNPSIMTHVKFLGAVDHNQIPSLIEQAQLCVYPSHMEAMPLSWLEVLAMGKTFIGSAIGPGFEIVEDKVTGLFCDPYNPVDIANKIEWVFDHPADAIEMGKRARVAAQKKCDIDKLIENNIAFYRQCQNGE